MNNFPKAEKLCGQLRIAALYKGGKRFTVFPLRVTCQRLENTSQPPRVLIWAPKSLFKHATDRNRLRRLMREAYRLQAQPLRDYCDTHNCSFLIAFNYMDKTALPYARIAHAVRKAIAKILTTDTTANQ